VRAARIDTSAKVARMPEDNDHGHNVRYCPDREWRLIVEWREVVDYSVWVCLRAASSLHQFLLDLRQAPLPFQTRARIATTNIVIRMIFDLETRSIGSIPA
jgi:hypothetical protein